MATAPHGAPTHHGKSGPSHAPVAVDPEHDIDARSATLWVVGGAIVLFVALWMMLPIFLRVLEQEKLGKVANAAPTERLLLVEQQRKFLDGDNPRKKSIDAVLKELAGK